MWRGESHDRTAAKNEKGTELTKLAEYLFIPPNSLTFFCASGPL
jgi:hypothetical protein